MKHAYKQLILFLTLLQSLLLCCMETDINDKTLPIIPKDIILHSANHLDMADASRLLRTCKSYRVTNYIGELTEESIKRMQFGIAQWLKKNPEKCKSLTAQQHTATFLHYSQSHNIDMIEFLINNESADNRTHRVNILACCGYIKSPDPNIALDEINNPLSTINAYNLKEKKIYYDGKIDKFLLPENHLVLRIMIANNIQFDFSHFFYAIENQHTFFIQYCINKYGVENAHDENGLTALHLIAQTSNIQIAQMLLDAGAKINFLSQTIYTENKEGKRTYKSDMRSLTPLHIACKKGSIEMVQFLLNNGADTNAESNNFSSSFANLKYYKYLYCPYPPGYKHNKYTKLLKYNLCNVTPLHIAASCNHINIMQLLIDNNADINSQDNCGNTPLHYACDNLQIDAVKTLIQNDVNVNVTNNHKQSPLLLVLEKYHAANSDQTKDITLTIVELLLNAQANCNAQDSFGFDARGNFCSCGRLQPMKDLINQRNPDNNNDTCSIS